jgi:hypothetical protein
MRGDVTRIEEMRNAHNNIVTCRVVRVTRMTGSSSDDCIC